ncbi:ATP-binding protein [Lusitaniella coriacea LEGE 07157]|uniref:ATP-binding protein n=1 Tax=Lusitaniella coriacea LEGE 07157 TaxID=945747 RepID=A0A8J7DX64_9CYAN|nr:ATP-binding protein [Lusitaniella coriacea]MBE9116947.1 ATP-binding protein [Lusitaniella coriacea LEGE 07157]
MLIEFSVGNFLSFKETVTFSMVAANITAKDKALDENNVFQIDSNLSLLKSAAIYGANASGKSNLAAAIGFMKSFTLNSSRGTQITDKILVEKFMLSEDTENQPSFFEIVFFLDNKKYRYGFEINRDRVISEWLFHVPNVRESKLFERNLDRFEMTNVFKEGKELDKKTRNNSLFLSVVAQFNGEIAKKILFWFAYNLSVISGVQDETYRDYTISSFESNRHKNQIKQFIKKLDLGIDDIQIDPKTRIVETIRKQYTRDGRALHKVIFDFDGYESDGTKKLFSLAGVLLESLTRGLILVIDELDARLHPFITWEIIDLFNSKETNKKNAQLIFMTHDTNLLSNKKFRRDQIWFTEKDRYGATHLYSLAEYKIRNDASFESDYLKGKYGAIPFIGDLRNLIKE